MKNLSPYVHTNYERKPDDDYKTIDPRCVQGLIETFPEIGVGTVIDVCSPNGSAIVDELVKLKIDARTWDNAFADGMRCDWVVSNTPYERPLVDDIIHDLLDKLADDDIRFGIALLYRTQFDHAVTRTDMFRDCKFYAGQIKLLFRPIWIEKKPGDKNPIHNYVWHIWKASLHFPMRLWYWEAK